MEKNKRAITSRNYIMDGNAIQTKLKDAGYYNGTVDGQIGPITYTAMLSYTVKHQLGNIGAALGVATASDFKIYNINTVNRIAHFIGQAAHETEGFRYFTELGGPSYFAKYDGRKDLGNVHPGDGYKYRGRGIFQITGCYNYGAYSKKLTNIDLLSHPEQAADPTVSMQIACIYWTDHGCNTLADADNYDAITHKINGGTNGAKERKEYTDRLKDILS